MDAISVCEFSENCERKTKLGCLDCPKMSVSNLQAKDNYQWFRVERHRQLLLVVICGVALLGGYAAERMGAGSGISTLLFLLAYLSGGYYGVKASVESLINRSIDVDFLMVIAALGAAWIGAPFEGAMLLFLFSLSNMLQEYALERSNRAIDALMRLRPEDVLCEQEGTQIRVPVENVEINMLVRLRSGDRIALDGEVVGGEATIDESSLTGESVPVAKQAGSNVFAGTINLSGSLLYKVTKTASNSTLARIVEMVEEAQSQKAKTQSLLETAERYYAMGVILMTIGLITLPVLFLGQGFSESFYRAMTVMVVASPCALIISTPAAFLSAIGGAARRGVLFKGGIHLERLASVDIVAFDKTGTLTEGKPKVTDIVAMPPESGNHADASRWQLDILKIAASLERQSEHPIARAIEQACSEKRMGFAEVSDFQSFSGKGILGVIESRRFAVGNPAFTRELSDHVYQMPEDAIKLLMDQGKTVVVVSELETSLRLKRVIGLIAVADNIRDNASYVIRRLRKLGVKRIVMLTGDNEAAAKRVADEVEITEVYSDLLPQDKLSRVKSLGNEGKVAMIGDGVNDAPALACAYTGIAMGAAGTEVAMQTADLVLMSSRLEPLLHAFALARKSRLVVTENLIFAFGVILLLVISALFLNLALPLGVVGHEGSTVLVCLNGLRLLGFKLKHPNITHV